MAGTYNYEKPETLADQIHDKILEMIVMSPEEDGLILNEKRLTDMFGCSKAPVREALIKLCSEGVLNNIPRVGYMVVRLNDRDMQDVYNLRVYLETENIRRIVGKLTEEELSKLKDQITRAAGKQNVDVWEVWNDNEEFHMMLADFAGNKIMNRIFTECLGIEKRAYVQRHWRTMNSMVDSVEGSSHKCIYEALRDGDLERAIQAIKNDVKSVPDFK